MKKSSTSLQNSHLFKQIKEKIKSKLKPIKQSQMPTPQNSKNRMIPIISQKRSEKIKHKAMFSNIRQTDFMQPQFSDLKDHEILMNRCSYDDEQEKNAYLLQIMRNETYLRKKKNTCKEVRNEGISIWNTRKNSWIFEQQNREQQIKGLNKFTNIVIKKLQKKCKKVSFSQFMEDKKQQDYLKKFKYNSSGKDEGKKPKAHSGQKNLKGIISNNKYPQNSEQHSNNHSRSVILTDSRKKYAKNRIYSKMHERYHSISGLKEGFRTNVSLLEISQIKGSQ